MKHRHAHALIRTSRSFAHKSSMASIAALPYPGPAQLQVKSGPTHVRNCEPRRFRPTMTPRRSGNRNARKPRFPPLSPRKRSSDFSWCTRKMSWGDGWGEPEGHVGLGELMPAKSAERHRQSIAASRLHTRLGEGLGWSLARAFILVARGSVKRLVILRRGANSQPPAAPHDPRPGSAEQRKTLNCPTRSARYGHALRLSRRDSKPAGNGNDRAQGRSAVLLDVVQMSC
jgi:hypothetical protein